MTAQSKTIMNIALHYIMSHPIVFHTCIQTYAGAGAHADINREREGKKKNKTNHMMLLEA